MNWMGLWQRAAGNSGFRCVQMIVWTALSRNHRAGIVAGLKSDGTHAVKRFFLRQDEKGGIRQLVFDGQDGVTRLPGHDDLPDGDIAVATQGAMDQLIAMHDPVQWETAISLVLKSDAEGSLRPLSTGVLVGGNRCRADHGARHRCGWVWRCVHATGAGEACQHTHGACRHGVAGHSDGCRRTIPGRAGQQRRPSFPGGHPDQQPYGSRLGARRDHRDALRLLGSAAGVGGRIHRWPHSGPDRCGTQAFLATSCRRAVAEYPGNISRGRQCDRLREASPRSCKWPARRPRRRTGLVGQADTARLYRLPQRRDHEA